MKVLICDGLDVPAVARLRAEGHEVDLRKGVKPDELMECIPEFDCVVVRSATKITKDVLERAKQLKLVVRGGVGLDNVDQNAAKDRGVTVHNTPGATTISVAEYTFSLMLALARHVAIGSNSVKSGEWNRKAFAGTELYGKTLGLIGFGRIGQEVAKRALAFKMDVLVHDHAIDMEVVEALEVTFSTLNNIFARADFLSLHLPLVPETQHLINHERLAMMKKTAYLINAARGGLIDEQALADAVTNGTIAGAAVDVYSVEPPGNENPLVGVPQILTLPHVGGSTAEGQTRASDDVARIICEF